MWDHATTPNGVLGSKLMFNDFDWLRSSLRPPAGTDAGLSSCGRVPAPSARLAAACGQGAARHLVVARRRDQSVGLRPGQDAGQPPPDVEQMVQLVRFAQRCEDGWRQWFAATGIQPCEVF
jgi:LPS sulfotransferase NodH